jgi:hypothetical protein
MGVVARAEGGEECEWLARCFFTPGLVRVVIAATETVALLLENGIEWLGS